jgi:protease IV
MAASGGYWVSCIGVPVFAEQGTITGSIGVFSLKLSFGTLLRRIGVHWETIALDSAAAAFSPDRPWSDKDESVLQETVDDVYQRFLRLVSSSRGLSIEKLESLAGGRVWSGSQAKANGLVDEIGGLDDAVAMVAKKAKIETFKLIHRPEPSTGLDLFQLLGESDQEDVLARLFSKEALDVIHRSGFSMGTLRLILSDIQSLSQNRPTVWALHPAEMKVR